MFIWYKRFSSENFATLPTQPFSMFLIGSRNFCPYLSRKKPTNLQTKVWKHRKKIAMNFRNHLIVRHVLYVRTVRVIPIWYHPPPNVLISKEMLSLHAVQTGYIASFIISTDTVVGNVHDFYFTSKSVTKKTESFASTLQMILVCKRSRK